MPHYHLIRDGEIVASREFAEGEEVPELAPNKGVWLPEVVDDPPLDPATEVKGGAVQAIEADRVLIAYPVRAKTAEEVAAMRVAKLAEIKAEARRRILEQYPEWKQANMTARGVELVKAAVARPWTAEEQAEADALQAAWDGIKAVRVRSDALEAAVPAEAAGIAAVDATQGWD